MIPDIKIFIIGGGILLLLGLIYLLKQQIILFALNRGISIIQKLILKVFITVSDATEPIWVLVEYPAKDRFTLGILSQTGEIKSTIYIPSGPRIIPGQVIFIDNKNWQHLNISFEEGLKVIITMGLASGTNEISRKIWSRMEDF